MKTRPTPFARSVPRERKTTTPKAAKTGQSEAILNASSCAAIVVPTSAPNITASAADSPISPRPAKEPTIIATAVLDCSITAAITPLPNALQRLRKADVSSRRNSGPSARVTPVRTIRMPQISNATLPTSSRRICVPAMLR